MFILCTYKVITLTLNLTLPYVGIKAIHICYEKCYIVLNNTAMVAAT